MGYKKFAWFGQGDGISLYGITVMVSIRSISDEAPAERASMK